MSVSVSVESAVESQMRVNDVFCAVSLNSTVQSASFCTHRFVLECGKPSAIFLLPGPWAPGAFFIKKSSKEKI